MLPSEEGALRCAFVSPETGLSQEHAAGWQEVHVVHDLEALALAFEASTPEGGGLADQGYSFDLDPPSTHKARPSGSEEQVPAKRCSGLKAGRWFEGLPRGVPSS